MKFLEEIYYEELELDPDRLSRALLETKVVVLRKCNTHTKHFFETLVSSMGRLVSIDEDLISGKPTGEMWIDIKYDPSVQGRYRATSSAQPLHTDASYLDIHDNVMFFFCDGQAALGGATVFIDTKCIIEALKLDGEIDLLQSLQEIPVEHAHAGANGVRRYKTKPILKREISQEGVEDWRINWNYPPATRGQTYTTADGKNLIERLNEFLENRVSKSGLVTPVLLEKSDAVFFHDELVLHGRNSFFATEKGERILLKCALILNSRMCKNPHLAQNGPASKEPDNKTI